MSERQGGQSAEIDTGRRHVTTDPKCIRHRPPRDRWQCWRFDRGRGRICPICRVTPPEEGRDASRRPGFDFRGRVIPPGEYVESLCQTCGQGTYVLTEQGVDCDQCGGVAGSTGALPPIPMTRATPPEGTDHE